LVDHDSVAVAHCLLNQTRQLVGVGVGTLAGDAATDLVVVQIHCFSVGTIVGSAFMGGSEVVSPALVETLGQQSVPVRVPEGIRVPIHDTRAAEGRLRPGGGDLLDAFRVGGGLVGLEDLLDRASDVIERVVRSGTQRVAEEIAEPPGRDQDGHPVREVAGGGVVVISYLAEQGASGREAQTSGS